MIKTSEIFNTTKSEDQIISPPDQVFRNQKLSFLITVGGHLVEDKLQYDKLMKILNEIGESQFLIKENIRITQSNRKTSFEALFSVNSNLDEFDAKISEFNEDFGMMTSHWFIHGQSKNWGIYMAEYPTINIIGCTIELVDKFKSVFNIVDNGYEQHKELLHRELDLLKNPKDRSRFFENYKFRIPFSK